jgi:hypothetical protein
MTSPQSLSGSTVLFLRFFFMVCGSGFSSKWRRCESKLQLQQCANNGKIDIYESAVRSVDQRPVAVG